jgi:hypothetical protein
MRSFFTILICFASLAFTGCKSQSQTGVDASQQLAAARIAEVPLPAATPFDSLPNERTAYLEAYRDGYRSGLVSLSILIGYPAIGDSFYSVRTYGWHSGASAGFGAHTQEIFSKMTTSK